MYFSPQKRQFFIFFPLLRKKSSFSFHLSLCRHSFSSLFRFLCGEFSISFKFESLTSHSSIKEFEQKWIAREFKDLSRVQRHYSPLPSPHCNVTSERVQLQMMDELVGSCPAALRCCSCFFLLWKIYGKKLWLKL